MFVFSNLAMSLDGKIATRKRGPSFLGTSEDHRIMQVLRRRADVVLFGASTLRDFKKPSIVTQAPLPKHQPANATLSHSLEGISPSWPFFKDQSFKRYLFVKKNPKNAKSFASSSEIIVLKSGSVAKQIISALKKRGIKNILVEGGGELMWNFASENLIDEYHVTLTPKIIGGRDAPTLVEGEGFDPREILRLDLASVKKKGGELFLVYRSKS